MELKSYFIPAEELDSRWLLIGLHGLGDSIEGYTWLPSELRLPWLNYLLVNAPDEYYGGYSWYDFYGDAMAGIERSRKLLTDLLTQKNAEGFPTDKTYLFGFSQGCLMTYETGLTYPHKLAGLVGVSGYIHDLQDLLKRSSSVSKEQRILATHGTLDPVLPFSKVKKQIQDLSAAGYGVEWHEFRKEHTIAGEEELKVIRDFILKPYQEAQS